LVEGNGIPERAAAGMRRGGEKTHIGRVAAVGSRVTKFRPGDRVGVGCMVAACRHCGACGKGWEQYCENGATYTYNGKREKLAVPVKYSIKSADGEAREIVKEYKNRLTKVKKADVKEASA
jgi:D-arabinose 1-dehydrogenase-like Zn-dependent alcohol dehydrogenase